MGSSLAVLVQEPSSCGQAAKRNWETHLLIEQNRYYGPNEKIKKYEKCISQIPQVLLGRIADLEESEHPGQPAHNNPHCFPDPTSETLQTTAELVTNAVKAQSG